MTYRSTRKIKYLVGLDDGRWLTAQTVETLNRTHLQNKRLLWTANSFLSSRYLSVACGCLFGDGASRQFELAAREPERSAKNKMISREIDVIKPSGETLSFDIEITAPEYDADFKAYGCRILFTGWLDSPPSTIKGEDSYQSLILAMQLVHSILRSYHSKGVRYKWRGIDHEYDLDMFLALPYPDETNAEQGSAHQSTTAL